VKLHYDSPKWKNKGNFDGFIKIKGTSKKNPIFYGKMKNKKRKKYFKTLIILFKKKQIIIFFK